MSSIAYLKDQISESAKEEFKAAELQHGEVLVSLNGSPAVVCSAGKTLTPDGIAAAEVAPASIKMALQQDGQFTDSNDQNPVHNTTSTNTKDSTPDKISHTDNGPPPNVENWFSQATPEEIAVAEANPHYMESLRRGTGRGYQITRLLIRESINQTMRKACSNKSFDSTSNKISDADDGPPPNVENWRSQATPEEIAVAEANPHYMESLKRGTGRGYQTTMIIIRGKTHQMREARLNKTFDGQFTESNDQNPVHNTTSTNTKDGQFDEATNQRNGLPLMEPEDGQFDEATNQRNGLPLMEPEDGQFDEATNQRNGMPSMKPEDGQFDEATNQRNGLPLMEPEDGHFDEAKNQTNGIPLMKPEGSSIDQLRWFCFFKMPLSEQPYSQPLTDTELFVTQHMTAYNTFETTLLNRMAHAWTQLQDGQCSEAVNILQNACVQIMDSFKYANEIQTAILNGFLDLISKLIRNIDANSRPLQFKIVAATKTWISTYIEASFWNLFGEDGSKQALILINKYISIARHLNLKLPTILYILKIQICVRVAMFCQKPSSWWIEQLGVIIENLARTDVPAYMVTLASYNTALNYRLFIENQDNQTLATSSLGFSMKTRAFNTIEIYKKLDDYFSKTQHANGLAWLGIELVRIQLPDGCEGFNVPKWAEAVMDRALKLSSFSMFVNLMAVNVCLRKQDYEKAKRYMNPLSEHGTFIAKLKSIVIDCSKANNQPDLQSLCKIPYGELHRVTYIFFKKKMNVCNKQLITSIMKDMLNRYPLLPRIWCHFPVWEDLIEPVSLPNLLFSESEFKALNLPQVCYDKFMDYSKSSYLSDKSGLMQEAQRVKNQNLFRGQGTFIRRLKNKNRRPLFSTPAVPDVPALSNLLANVDIDDYQNPNPRRFY